MDDQFREQLRRGLEDAYKPRQAEGFACVCCGKSDIQFVLHVIEYDHSESIQSPKQFVKMSNSYGSIRGSVPLCINCFPVCRACGLPIATRVTAKLIDLLSEKYPDISFRNGNGYCRHLHLGRVLLSIFQRPRFAISNAEEKRAEKFLDPEVDRLMKERDELQATMPVRGMYEDGTEEHPEDFMARKVRWHRAYGGRWERNMRAIEKYKSSNDK